MRTLRFRSRLSCHQFILNTVMPEPITCSVAAVAVAEFVGHSIGSHVIGEEAHQFIERWRESAMDSITALPRNRDLHHASLESLRGAVQVLILELAGRIDPKRSWLTRWAERTRWADLLTRELFAGSPDPNRQWLDGFRGAVNGKAFEHFHDSLGWSDDKAREVSMEGDLCEALGEMLERLSEWVRANVVNGTEHPDFEELVLQGWEIRDGHAKTAATEAPLSLGLAEKHVALQPPPAQQITLARAYCLFFREHLKRKPEAFRSFTAETLNDLRKSLGCQGSALGAELQSLREEVVRLANNPPGLTAFEAWLTPQLGAIHDLLSSVRDDLDVLARGQGELADQQGEILVAITTLRTEVARNGTLAELARAQLVEITALISRFDRKLDYAIAGLPIHAFKKPDPPSHELQLLQAKYRAVDLVGRETDLDSLWQWLTTGENISARLIVGRAGTGKTRLAFELLLRANAELPRWQAGVIEGRELRTFDANKQPADWRWPVPTLVVVDYAQTVTGPLAGLLRALTYKRRDHALPRLRILLLERDPGEWFEALLREEDSAGPCPVSDLFDPPKPVSLTPLPKGNLRRHVLSQALNEAAKLPGGRLPTLPPEGDSGFEASLMRDIFAEPLNLILAALAGNELGLSNALTRSRVELAQELAGKELRRLRLFARTPGNAAQERMLQHLAACATLERGFSSEESKRAAREELAALEITWPDGPGDLDSALRAALPNDRLAVAPIEPDFVGEAFVLLVLAKRCGQGGGGWRDWIAVVERCSRRDKRATPATLFHAFQNFGSQVEFGEPLLVATDALIRAGLADGDPTLLMGIESAMPGQTVELRQRAMEVTRHLYTRLKAAVRRGPGDLTAELSRLANNLAIRLSELGQREEALAPAKEAVELYRALAGRNPDAFDPDLAGSLSNLAGLLSELGQREEALAPAKEAVGLYRALAGQNPDAFNPDLAMSLNNLAILLGGLGQWAEALAPAKEAVELYRALAGQNPGAFNPALAGSLNNLANRLSELGERVEALAPAKEAVEIRRALAGQNPDAFNPDLAMSLNNLAVLLSELGERVEALAPAKEAVELYRALAGRNPGAFDPDLAGSLNNLALLLSESGQRGEAMRALAEAVAALKSQFLRFPQTHELLMRRLVADYQAQADATKTPPDAELFAPILAKLKSLGPDAPSGE